MLSLFFPPFPPWLFHFYQDRFTSGGYDVAFFLCGSIERGVFPDSPADSAMSYEDGVVKFFGLIRRAKEYVPIYKSAANSRCQYQIKFFCVLLGVGLNDWIEIYQ